jgi:hypothetical protein
LGLTNPPRSATIQRLEDIIKTGKSNADELASLRQNTDALRSGIRLTEIGPNVEQQLSKLLHVSDTALQAVIQHHILNSLSFGEMHRRFDTVGHASHETFEWILEETSESDVETKPKAMKSPFRDWLISGNGVFHIAGKLGSGKSTLLKFLKKHHRTTELLDIWAAERQLVIGTFFFWKPGTEMENSIHGLVRTLLYDVLKQCPELISLVFPDPWLEVQRLPLQASVKLRLEPDQIYDAFRRLIHCRNSDKSRCFCFFIDGLDEFERAGTQDYGYLVDLLQGWTRRSPEDAQLCEDIKLCVSSREDNVFMDSFANTPRIKLQDLNRSDLVNFVQERLESHRLFSTLEFTEEITYGKFVDQIVDHASGVFLWAALVMITLREGLDDGDGVSELQSKLDSTPSDLKRLFRDLIAKIHERDRQLSARTFSIISTLWNCCQTDRITLFAYSLLDDFVKDPEYAINLPAGPRISDEQITHRLNRARKQLYGRCRGLLEVRDRRPWGNPPQYFQTALQHNITVVHRSVHEFLQTPEGRDWMVPYLGEFSPVIAICQSTIAMIKLLNPMKGEDIHIDTNRAYVTAMDFHTEIRLSLCCLSKSGSDIETQLKILDCLNEILPQPQWHTSPVIRKMVYSEPAETDSTGSLPYFHVSAAADFLCIHHAAAYVGLIEYVEWNFKTDHILHYGPWYMAGFFVILAWEGSIKLKKNLLPILVSTLERGLSPNMTSPQHAGTALIDAGKEIALSVWHTFFINTFCPGWIDRIEYVKTMELMLKFGADPRISISSPELKRVEDAGSSKTRQYQIFLSFSPFNKPIQKLWPLDSDSPLFNLLCTKEKISLRDWFEFEGREELKPLLALIDRNMKLLEQSPTALNELPLLLAKEAESNPPSESAEPSQAFSGKEDAPKSEQSNGMVKKAKGAAISHLEKYLGERMAHILLDKILGHPLASFLLGKSVVPHVLLF